MPLWELLSEDWSLFNAPSCCSGNFFFFFYHDTEFTTNNILNGRISGFFGFIIAKQHRFKQVLQKSTNSWIISAFVQNRDMGVIVKLLPLNIKWQLAVAVFREELQRQASPDPVNYVQQLKKMRRTLMKAVPLLLCSAEPICFALGLTEGAPCAHWDPEASHVTPHWGRRSQRGGRFSLGCIISVPAQFREGYFSSVPLRITERAARMSPLFSPYILSH